MVLINHYHCFDGELGIIMYEGIDLSGTGYFLVTSELLT